MNVNEKLMVKREQPAATQQYLLAPTMGLVFVMQSID